MFSCFKTKTKSIDCDHSEVRERDAFALDDPECAEQDPSGRYVRSDEILGKGEFKTVYKAFDQFDGIEVAWNQIRIDDKKLVHSPEDIASLYSEVSLLKALKHENVVKCYCSWVNKDLSGTMNVNMITELFTSGDLRQYRRKHKNIDIKAIRNWARQILRGLHYLHTHDTPIIHRDLQGGNIFINGNTGRVKIGDLGRAVVLRDQPASDCNFIIGKAEFLAPELHKGEEYNQLVDIYAFGMCILEMATCEYPYSVCDTCSQLSVHVTSGHSPASLSKVADPGLKQFIEKCLVPAPMRPSASELLNDPFLGLSLSSEATRSSVSQLSQPMDIDSDGKESCNSTAFSESNIGARSPITLSVSKSSKELSFTLSGKEGCNNHSISMTLRITGLSSDAYKIDFVFDLQKDTSSSVAEEMVGALSLSNEDAILISGLLDELIEQLATNHSGSQSSLPQQMKDSDQVAQESLSSACSSMELRLRSSSGTPDNPSCLSSISFVDLDDSYDQCNELKMELDAIDAEYEQRKAELMKTREYAIESAKKKWASGKSSVT